MQHQYWEQLDTDTFFQYFIAKCIIGQYFKYNRQTNRFFVVVVVFKKSTNMAQSTHDKKGIKHFSNVVKIYKNSSILNLQNQLTSKHTKIYVYRHVQCYTLARKTLQQSGPGF